MLSPAATVRGPGTKKLLGAVNFNVRFHEACRQAKELIRAPEFGGVQFIHGSYLQEFHLLPADQGWRYDAELGGRMRAVTEIGSHWIDLARYWSGLEVEAVSAAFGCFNQDRRLDGGLMYAPTHKSGKAIRVESEDAASVTLRFSNGALGHILLSEVSPGRSNAISIEASGAQSAVWWHSEDPYRLNHSAGKFNGYHTTVQAFSGGFPDTFAAFFDRVYDALQSGFDADVHADYPTFEDGYRNAAVCDAIYRSAQNSSMWVKISR